MTLTYTTLIGSRDTEDSIKNWANNSSIPATAMLRDAQLKLFERLRIREMLVDDTGTLATDAERIDFSALTDAATRQFRAPYHFQFTGSERSFPTFKMLDFVKGQRTWDPSGARTKGRPRYYALDAAGLQFDVPALAVAGYPWEITYYGDLDPLGPTATKNVLTTKYPRLLRLQVMVFVNEWKKDKAEKAYYRELVHVELGEVNAAADLEMENIHMEMVVDGDAGVSGGLHGYGNL